MQSTKLENDLLKSREKSQPTEKTNQLGTSVTVARFDTPLHNSSEYKRQSKGYSQRYKTEEAEVSKKEDIHNEKSHKRKKSSILENKITEKIALQSLKKSETMLKDIVLPEIQSNK